MAANTNFNPEFLAKFEQFKQRMRELGHDIDVVEGIRTAERQKQIFDEANKEGIWKTDFDGINKKSLHQLGRGVDIIFIKNGKRTYEGPWDKVGQVAKEVGLNWGGDWKEQDRTHLELPELIVENTETPNRVLDTRPFLKEINPRVGDIELNDNTIKPMGNPYLRMPELSDTGREIIDFFRNMEFPDLPEINIPKLDTSKFIPEDTRRPYELETNTRTNDISLREGRRLNVNAFKLDKSKFTNNKIKKGPWWNPIHVPQGKQIDEFSRKDRQLFDSEKILNIFDSNVEKVADKTESFWGGFLTSLAAEPARLAIETFSQPESVVGGGLLKGKAPTNIKPIPKPAPKQLTAGARFHAGAEGIKDISVTNNINLRDIPNKAFEAARKARLDEKVAEEASKNPVTRNVLFDYVKANSPNNPFAFAGTRLKSLGKAGKELYRRSARYTQEERFNIKDWASKYKEAFTKLSKEERAVFGEYVEGTRPIPNDKVRAAVDEWKRAEDLTGSAAEQVGMIIQTATGKKIPFKKATNYWPRRLTKEQLAKMPSKIEQMIKEGMTREEAHKVIEHAKKFGELILPAQRERVGKLFKYRTDAESGLYHLESMAKQVARTKNFGRYDLTGKGNKGIADLIEQSDNPELARKILKRVIGRDEEVDKTLDQAVRVARTAVSWIRLQNYGVASIIGNQLPNMLRSNMKEYFKALAAFRKSKLIGDDAAAMIDISHGVFEQTRKLNPMKVYGGTFTENLVRSHAAGFGQGMARTFFRKLKANPNNAKLKSELFELILEDVDEVLKQKSLSPKQLRMAAARSAELSQGLTNVLNQPLFASKPISSAGDAILQLSLIFKKQATIQTKVLKDAIKANPAKAVPLILAFSQIGGGIIGGVKSTIKGTARAIISGRDVGETIVDDYNKRANYVKNLTGSDNEQLNRAIDRALQSWSFGIVGDLLSMSLGGRSALLEGVTGPVVGAAVDIGGNLTNPEQLGRETLRMLPIPGGVGSAIQQEVLPTRNQKRKKNNMFSFDFK